MALNHKGIDQVLAVASTIASVEATTVYPKGMLVVDSSNNIRIGDGSTAGGTGIAGASGYVNSDVDAHLNTGTATANQVLSWTGTDYDWVAQTGGGGGGSLNNVVEDTTPQLGGTLDANGNTIDMGTNTITDTKVGYWDTAYGWGDHGSAGYQTSSGLNGAIDTHLNQSNPTSGYVLSWNGSDYAWTANGTGSGLGDIVDDTTPQLGGDLDTNGKNILLLNNRIKYNSAGGSFLDFTVDQYSVPNNTVLNSVGSINLFLDSNSADVSGDTAFRIFDTTDPDGTVTEANNIFKVADTGDVSIKGKLQFPDGGASSNYAAFGANDDLKIFHNGNHSIVRETGTGNLYLQSNDNVILSKDSDTEIMVKGIADGAVELYHDNVKKFETTATGVQAVDDVLIQGATPYLTIRRTNNANIPLIRFQGSAGANGATIGMDGTGGSVNDLIISAYGNAERLRIETNGGVKVTGDLTITGRTDIKGSVFGDDSTVIVDSVNSAVTAKLISVNGPEPTSGSDAGEVGEIRFSDNYIYIKTAGFGWKRANLSGIA
tara:strand:+ start:1326 stop:2957 length:1632 start_codon:yes stop_codon:yes gene_type:complete